jgi:hypothetical protein
MKASGGGRRTAVIVLRRRSVRESRGPVGRCKQFCFEGVGTAGRRSCFLKRGGVGVRNCGERRAAEVTWLRISELQGPVQGRERSPAGGVGGVRQPLISEESDWEGTMKQLQVIDQEEEPMQM